MLESLIPLALVNWFILVLHDSFSGTYVNLLSVEDEFSPVEVTCEIDVKESIVKPWFHGAITKSIGFVALRGAQHFVRWNEKLWELASVCYDLLGFYNKGYTLDGWLGND